MEGMVGDEKEREGILPVLSFWQNLTWSCQDSNPVFRPAAHLHRQSENPSWPFLAWIGKITTPSTREWNGTIPAKVVWTSSEHSFKRCAPATLARTRQESSMPASSKQKLQNLSLTLTTVNIDRENRVNTRTRIMLLL